MQTTAAALQVRRRPAPAGQALRGPATTCQPLRLRLAYLRSRLSALRVATPWVNPCAVAVTNEQCRAWAGCGARLKAAIVLTAIAATSNLLMVLPSLHGHGFSHRLQHTILTRFIDPSSLGRWLWLSQVKSVPISLALTPSRIRSMIGLRNGSAVAYLPFVSRHSCSVAALDRTHNFLGV